eukprot:CAMPEP_0182875592 /NCGR_PEP_ID=MMETSP0034_2-20130328/13636_1 /TAXON_ID=156128 /ORGANISM="Nephroselmis pyriformis, Strain CCMP717" /LENGTH=38 /DNA_ID= /DNA_START= /DNA_END= /DNA_ORIENTATION=
MRQKCRRAAPLGPPQAPTHALTPAPGTVVVLWGGSAGG